MREFIDIVNMMEEISEEDMPSILLLLDSMFDPHAAVIEVQYKASEAEENFGNQLYRLLFNKLVDNINGHIIDYSRLLTNGILDAEDAIEEKEQAISLVKILESLLERTKNNDLSWAWEDIKL